MAWNMSAEKRRALVKLQLRDKHGRWIEMGGGVKWYSHRLKMKVAGTVVGGKDKNALVRLNKEYSSNKKHGDLVSVPADSIEVVDDKATIPNAPSADQTPQFEKPAAVADHNVPSANTDSNNGAAPLDDRVYPPSVNENDPNSYKSTKTPDDKFYFGRADSQGIYTPAKDLQVGDELIAPDGTEDAKPFSIGAGWNRRGVERVADGKGIGTVESIVPDRYAIVKLPEGYAAPDGRDTVTVGLRSDVIKATPGLKQSLESAGFKFNENSPNSKASAPNGKPSDAGTVERGIMNDRRQRNNEAKVSAAQQGDKLVADRPEGALTFTKTGDNQWSNSDGGSGMTDHEVSSTPIMLNEWSPAPLTGKKDNNGSSSDNKTENAPQEPTAPSDPAEAPSKAAETPLSEVIDGVGRIEQDMEDISTHNLTGTDLSAALEEATYSFTAKDGLPYTISGRPEGDGEWSYNVTNQEGTDVGNWIPAKFDSSEEVAKSIHDTINKTRPLDPSANGQENGNAPSAPEPANAPEPGPVSYNENGLTPEEQQTADALTRMIARAEAAGNFDKADQLSSQLAQMMRSGEDRKNPTAPEPAKAPEPAPKLIEPDTKGASKASEPSAPAAPNLIEPNTAPEPVNTPAVDAFDAQKTAKSLTSLQRSMIVAMRDHGWSSHKDIKTGAVRHALQQKELIRGGSSADREKAFVITDKGRAVADAIVAPVGDPTDANQKVPSRQSNLDGFLNSYDITADPAVTGLKKDESGQHDYTMNSTSADLVKNAPIGTVIETIDQSKRDAFHPYVKIGDNLWVEDKGAGFAPNELNNSDMVESGVQQGLQLPKNKNNPFTPEDVQKLIDKSSLSKPAEPEKVNIASLLQKTDDGFEVRASKDHIGFAEVVSPDGTIERRVDSTDPEAAHKISAGLDYARKSYAARQEAQQKREARQAEIAALTPFAPTEITVPAAHFREANKIQKGDRLLTITRQNGTEAIAHPRRSDIGIKKVELSGKSALVIDSKPIMGQNKTSLGTVVGNRLTVQHTDGSTEKIDLYANRGGSSDKAGVILDSPEFRKDLGLDKSNGTDPNKTEGNNGSDTGTNGTNTGTGGSESSSGTSGTDTKSGEGSAVSGPAGGDGGSSNDPASGGNGSERGNGPASGSDTGLPLSKEAIDNLPDGALLVDGEGSTLAKNAAGEWYPVAQFLQTGEKDGLPSDMLAGGVTRRDGTRKYGDEELHLAVDHFIDHSFKNVNDYIRNGNDPYESVSGYTPTVVDVIDDGIANSPLAKDSTFYRGLQISEATAANFVAGSIINDKGFTSITSSKDVGEEFAHHSAGLTGIPAPENHVPVILQVNLPQGHNVLGVDYSKLDNGRGKDFSHQQESILARDTSLKVDSVSVSEKDGKKVYTLQVSPATQEDLKAIPTAAPEPASNNFPEGIIRRTPETVPGEKYPPTQQQQDVIDAVLGGLDTKVQAMAGTGKTSTLVALSRRIKEQGGQAIYIAFNKTVQQEAEDRMKGLPVEAKTGHGVAYQWALKNAPHLIARLNGGDPTRPTKYDKNGKANDWAPKSAVTSSYKIANLLDINNGDIKSVEGDGLSASTTVLAVKKAVEKFALSDKDTVTLDHVPEAFNIHDDSKQAVVDLANKYWADIVAENGNFRVTHDSYRKVWALSRPDLTDGSGGNKAGANILYIDEAQDTPPVLAKVVADQKMQKVIVGDPNQAIYAFAENIDYLSQAKGDIELPLNKSWRFGPKVADIGNRFLEFLGSKDRVVGGGPESSITYGMENADAVLVRTNAGMISAILDEAKRGRRVSAPNGTREDLTKLIKTVQGLMDHNPLEAPHDDLIGFKDWGQVLNAYNNGDTSLNKIVNLFDVVDAFSVSRLNATEIANLKKQKMDNAVKAVDSLVVKVAKSDGVQITKEGERTYLSPVDVHPDPKMAGKWVGRPKQYAVDNFSQELGKVRAPEAFDKSLRWTDQMYEYHQKGGLGTMGFKKDRATGRWYTDSPEAAQKLMTYFGESDVTVSTAHKSKGLEWDRVRIGDDFFVPREDPKTGSLVFPEDPAEYKLAYVAVTRAAKELDPGVLGWIYEHTSENGGDPNKVSEPKVDPVSAPAVEPDPVNVPTEPSPGTPEPVNTPAPVEPTPVPVEPTVAPTEPAAPVAPTEPTVAPTVPTEPAAPVEPAPAPPVEPAAPTAPTPVPGYNANGYTEGEQKRVDALEALIAKVYKGDAKGDVYSLENELDNYYAAGESRLNGVDVPEIKHNPEPATAPKAPTEPAVAPVKPEPVNTPTPAPKEPAAPTDPTAKAPATAPTAPRRTSRADVVVKSFDGTDLVEGMQVRHPKYTGEVIKVIRSAGTVKIRKADGTEVIAKGHKVSVIGEGSDPVPAPKVPTNMTVGSAGIDSATGLPYFVGKDGKVHQNGETIVHPKKGEGTVKSIYVGATSVAVDWADGTSSRSQAAVLSGKGDGGSSPEPAKAPAVEPTKPEPTKPEPAPAPPVEPTPAPPVEPSPAVKLTGQFTDPVPAKKLSVTGGIEGGDPVGTNGPVSPHGEPVPGGPEDNIIISMAYPQGSVITYHNKTRGVVHRIIKGESDLWYELNPDGSYNKDQFHQWIPTISRVQQYVKVDPNGKRDGRNAAPDNEAWLNSIPIGGTVTTSEHWDGNNRVWTKLADGFWKSPDSSTLNYGLHNYGIVDVSGIDGDVPPFDAQKMGWASIPSGPTRAMQLFKLTEGAQVTFPKSPHVHYVKEDGKWAQIIRGRKTGITLANLNNLSNKNMGSPAYILHGSKPAENFVPKREQPTSMPGDPREIASVFGADAASYMGIDNLFREYNRNSSPFNAMNLEPMQPETKWAYDAETTNSRGDKFVLGARVYDKNGDYVGKVGAIYNKASAYNGESLSLIHPRGSGVYDNNHAVNKTYNPEDVTTVRTKNWDTSTDLEFSDYKSVQDIESKMKETYGGMHYQLLPTSTDIRMAREFSSTVSKIFNKYPMLQESMAFVGTQEFGRQSSANAAALSYGPGEYGITGFPDNNSYEPRYGHVGTRVGFNVSKSYNTFVRTKQEGQLSRWNNFVAKGKEVEATTTHEFGHVIDYFTGVINEQKILEMVSTVLGRKVTKNNSALGSELYDNKLLSGYSLKNGKIYPVELVAESFQDVEMNGANAKELSKLVHQELMRRLAILGNVSVDSSAVDPTAAVPTNAPEGVTV